MEFCDVDVPGATPHLHVVSAVIRPRSGIARPACFVGVWMNSMPSLNPDTRNHLGQLICALSRRQVSMGVVVRK